MQFGLVAAAPRLQRKRPCRSRKRYKARRILIEAIRLQPGVAEPYHTLGVIYEEVSPKKALEFFVVAAQLTPQDIQLWKRCGMMSEFSEAAFPSCCFHFKIVKTAGGKGSFSLLSSKIVETCLQVQAGGQDRAVHLLL